MVAKLGFVVLAWLAIVMAVTFVFGIALAEAHATGSFHWVNEQNWWGIWTSCLHGPSGAVLYCY